MPTIPSYIKSFIPCQMLVILGFIINSSTVTTQLTTEKAVGLKTVCVEFLRVTTLSVCEVVSVIDRIVASFPGVLHGPLYYRLPYSRQRAILMLVCLFHNKLRVNCRGGAIRF